MVAVVLVSGPPCSGKSTFVAERAGPGDEVLDLDAIARERFGSRTGWDHLPRQWRAADDYIRSRTRQIAASGTARSVWVVRGLPDGHTRQLVAGFIKATRRVLLLPPGEVLQARARTRPDPDQTLAAIHRWFAQYSPDPGDEVITDAVARII